MRKIVFVTGTDTGVGKTTVLYALVRQLRRRGVLAVGVKPIESGCEKDGAGMLVPADAVQLASASSAPLEETILYRLGTPVAPQVAAEIEGRPIDWQALCDWTYGRIGNPLFVEGAGGPLVPICGDKTFADLTRTLEAQCLVVVGSKLGCLNHAALTFEALRVRGFALAGYVMNDLYREEVSDVSLKTNRAELARIGKKYGVEEIGYLPRLVSLDQGVDLAEFRLEFFKD